MSGIARVSGEAKKVATPIIYYYNILWYTFIYDQFVYTLLWYTNIPDPKNLDSTGWIDYFGYDELAML